MLKFDCPKCLEPLTFGEERRGDDVRCPNCRTLLRLPGKPTAAAKPVAVSRSATPAAPAKPKPPPPDDEHMIDAAEVVRQPRKRRKRRRTSESFEMPEWLVPLGLLACAFVVNASIALSGGDIGKRLLIFTLIGLVVAVPSTIAGMFVAAAAMGINFGNIFTAAVKVAAITAVVQCIYLIGLLGSADGSAMIVILLALPVYYGMFCWLFELTFVEALVATFIIGLVQKCVNLAVTLVAAGILMKAAVNGP